MTPSDIEDYEHEAYVKGCRAGKEWMRERAAKAVEEMTLQLAGNVSIRDQVALTIRALPLDPETGGESG